MWLRMGRAESKPAHPQLATQKTPGASSIPSPRKVGGLMALRSRGQGDAQPTPSEDEAASKPDLTKGSEAARAAGRLFGSLLAGALNGVGRVVGEDLAHIWLHQR